MTNEFIEYLGQCYRNGVRSPWLLGHMKKALYACESGECDPGFGRELESAIAQVEQCTS